MILQNYNLIIQIQIMIFAIASLLLAVGLGPVTVSPGNVVGILLSKIPGIGNAIAHTWT